ncbi:MAG: cupin domain-containing protein, partial [Chloroflexota bacterium]
GIGNTITIAAGQEDTGNVFALLDYELAPGFAGLPPHRHQNEDVAIYVLEGHLQVWVGQTQRRLGPGDFIFLPRGITHGPRNAESEPTRFLLFLIPAGFERCFRDLEAALGEDAVFSAEIVAPLLAGYGVRTEAFALPSLEAPG